MGLRAIWKKLGGAPRDSAALDAELDLKADADDLLTISNGLNQVSAEVDTKADLENSRLKRIQFDEPTWSLPNLWNKLFRIRAAESATQARFVIGGDSMGIRTQSFVHPVLRAGYGQAGCGAWAGVNELMFPSGTGVQQPSGSFDHTQSPCGRWVAIDSTNTTSIADPFSSSPSIFPYGSTLQVTNSSLSNCDRATVMYTCKTGLGVFKLQVSADGTNFTDVGTVDSASGATGSPTLGIATFIFAAQTVVKVRALYVSGAGSQIIYFHLRSSTAIGIDVHSIALGSMSISRMAQSPLMAAFVTYLNPDCVTVEAKNNADSLAWSEVCDLWCNPWSSTTDLILSGSNEDVVSDNAANNLAWETKAAAIGAAYLDPRKSIPSYAECVTLGWMEDTTHRNARASGYVALDCMRKMGLFDSPLQRTVFPLSIASATIASLAVTTITGGTFSGTSVAATTGTLGATTIQTGDAVLNEVNTTRDAGAGATEVRHRIENTNASGTCLAGVKVKTGASSNVWQFFARAGNAFIGIAGVLDVLQLSTSTGNVTALAGHFITSTIGRTLQVKSGTNAKAGTFTLSSGTVTVANTSITANSVVIATLKTSSGTRAGTPDIVPTSGVGFVATGGGSDNSTYNFVVLEVN